MLDSERNINNKVVKIWCFYFTYSKIALYVLTAHIKTTTISKPFKNNVLTVNFVILTIINYNEFSQELPIKWVPLLLFLEQFLFEKNKTTEVLL